MDDADDFTGGVLDWKMLEAGAVEAVQGEGAEGFVLFNIGDVSAGQHQVGDLSGGKVDGGNNVLAFVVGEDGVGSAAEQGQEFGGGSRSVGFRGDLVGGSRRFGAGLAAVGLKLGIDPARKTAEKPAPATVQVLAQLGKSLTEALPEGLEGAAGFLE